jgi:diguanylate cyclase (GGDEF)-like protein/PAS domain S-box-containing protein
LDGAFLRVNDRLCEFFRCTRQQLIGTTYRALTLPEDLDRSPPVLERLLRGDGPVSIEKRYRRFDGSVMWAAVTISIGRTAAGEPDYFINVVHDVTERKRAEDELRRFRAAIDAAVDMVFLLDPERMRYVDVNDAACRILGYTREELLALNVGDITGLSQQHLLRSYNQLIAGDRAEAFVRRDCLCKDGSLVPTEAHRRIVESDEGPIIVVTCRDISERIAAEEALHRSNERFQMVSRATKDVIWDWNAVADTVWWSENARAVFGYDPGRAGSAEAWFQAIHPEDRERVRGALRRRLGEPGASWQDEYRFRRADGSYVHVLDRGSSLCDESGRVTRMVGAMIDISERHLAEREIRDFAAQQETIAKFGQLALASTDLDALIDHAVELVTGALGVPFGKVLQLGPDGESLILKAGRGWAARWVGTRIGSRSDLHAGYVLSRQRAVVVEDFASETRFRPSDMVTAHGVRSGVEVLIGSSADPYGVIGVHSTDLRRFSDRNVSFLSTIANVLSAAVERGRAEERLSRLAQFDILTQLPNRSLLRDRLSQSLAQAQRNGWSIGVMFIDLDRFKYINDTFGHTVGDKLLGQVAERLKGSIRQGDTVGRLGGDEFAVVLSRIARPQDAGLVAGKLIAALAAPFDLEGRATYISGSVGIAIYPEDGADLEALLKNADTAMYRAKEEGRNNYQFFVPQLNERAMRRMELETSLRGALERGEFVLQYQPKLDLARDALSGFEALLRWSHPQRGMVAPCEFIPILEDTGLIAPVGEWVLRTVCAQIRAWAERGLTPVPVAVNISARQFAQGRLDQLARRIVDEAGVAPALIELELTESMLMHDPEEAIGMLKGLKAAGFRLSVDDFGTGYSSLAYLQRFPIDALKIDRAFVKEIVNRRGDAQIAVAIIDLAHNLELDVVAEGVETAEQAEFLRDNDCDQIQGYFVARPLDVEDATRLLAAPGGASAAA